MALIQQRLRENHVKCWDHSAEEISTSFLLGSRSWNSVSTRSSSITSGYESDLHGSSERSRLVTSWDNVQLRWIDWLISRFLNSNDIESYYVIFSAWSINCFNKTWLMQKYFQLQLRAAVSMGSGHELLRKTGKCQNDFNLGSCQLII